MWPAAHPYTLSLRMNPTTHCTGGWVVPRAHPDGYGGKKISHLHRELEPWPVRPSRGVLPYFLRFHGLHYITM